MRTVGLPMSSTPGRGCLFRRSASASAATLALVVPWLDQHPAKPSSKPPLAAPCRAGDLSAHLFLQGATGSLVGGVDLFNGGTSACSLVGRPTVSLTGTTAAQVQIKGAAQPKQPEVLADPPGSLRALQPGKSASAALFWSTWCGARPDALTLGLASGTTINLPLAHAPRCDAPHDPSAISVGRFTPTPRRLPMSSRLPLRVAIVGSRPVQVKPGLRAFRVHRGERFGYEVAVTNTGPRPFRFAASSCPSYIEQFGDAPAQVYVLNCRPVDTIAPRQTVLFRMQLTVPVGAQAGNTSLTWQLAPKTYEAPFTAAAAWVAKPAHLALRWLQMIDEARGYALPRRAWSGSRAAVCARRPRSVSRRRRRRCRRIARRGAVHER
jgi:hypothetical protein